jgi:hypothetical protein
MLVPSFWNLEPTGKSRVYVYHWIAILKNQRTDSDPSLVESDIEPGLTLKQCSRKLENQVKGHTLNCQSIAGSFMKGNSCLKLFQNPKLEILLILAFLLKKPELKVLWFSEIKKEKLELEVISKILKKSELEIIEKIRELQKTGYYSNT